MIKVAVCGFQHGHIGEIVKLVRERPDMEIVGAAEAAPETCKATIAACGLEVRYRTLDELLDAVDCDVVALADIYSARGPQAIKALEAGKHVVADKPLCTSVAQCDRIAALSTKKKLSVILQLTLRYVPLWHAARKALLDGEIGEIATVAIFGRHPLRYKNGRPDWYFEEGKQCGTINDLMVHGVDSVEWLSGLRIDRVIAARAWNMELRREAPFFQDGAQAMLRMNNGAGVIMDCSYKAPVGHPEPWTLHFNGDQGDLNVNYSSSVTLRRVNEKARTLEPAAKPATNYIQDLCNEITGGGREQIITTAESLRASRIALLMQEAADQGRTNVDL